MSFPNSAACRRRASAGPAPVGILSSAQTASRGCPRSPPVASPALARVRAELGARSWLIGGPRRARSGGCVLPRPAKEGHIPSHLGPADSLSTGKRGLPSRGLPEREESSRGDCGQEPWDEGRVRRGRMGQKEPRHPSSRLGSATGTPVNPPSPSHGDPGSRAGAASGRRNP